jgi:hypothetical protein
MRKRPEHKLSRSARLDETLMDYLVCVVYAPAGLGPIGGFQDGCRAGLSDRSRWCAPLLSQVGQRLRFRDFPSRRARAQHARRWILHRTIVQTPYTCPKPERRYTLYGLGVGQIKVSKWANSEYRNQAWCCACAFPRTWWSCMWCFRRWGSDFRRKSMSRDMLANRKRGVSKAGRASARCAIDRSQVGFGMPQGEAYMLCNKTPLIRGFCEAKC